MKRFYVLPCLCTMSSTSRGTGNTQNWTAKLKYLLYVSEEIYF